MTGAEVAWINPRELRDLSGCLRCTGQRGGKDHRFNAVVSFIGRRSGEGAELDEVIRAERKAHFLADFSDGLPPGNMKVEVPFLRTVRTRPCGSRNTTALTRMMGVDIIVTLDHRGGRGV